MRIIWSPEAAGDLDEAVTYLAGLNSTAAHSLATGIFALIERLAAEPIEGPSHTLRTGEVVHGWPLPPFRIYYQRQSEALLVIRIYHQRREPIER